jgi:hypothetical protein
MTVLNDGDSATGRPDAAFTRESSLSARKREKRSSSRSNVRRITAAAVRTVRGAHLSSVRMRIDVPIARKVKVFTNHPSRSARAAAVRTIPVIPG